MCTPTQRVGTQIEEQNTTLRATTPAMRHATAPAMKQEAVRVRGEPWDASEGSRSVWLHASTASERNIGECGLEVRELDADGLLGDGNPPRATLTGTLYVQPKYRRQGIAQRLLREAETHARLWGFGELLLPVDAKNHKAIHLYEKMGYTHQRVTEYHGNKITMKRSLYAPNMHTVHSMFNRHTPIE